MLNYLILSYQTWSSSQDLDDLPGSFTPTAIVALAARIWQWLTASTLFQNFAATICANDENFWWTSNALLATMTSALFISIEGSRRNIPHLSAYLAIGQILPISFAQNLFFLAILIYPLPSPPPTDQLDNDNNDNKVVVSSVQGPSLQIVPLLAYYYLLYELPHRTHQPFFLFLVILIRLLLLSTYLGSYFLLPASTKQIIPRGQLHRAYIPSYTTALICSGVVVVWQCFCVLQGTGLRGLRDLKGALSSDPAVSALGWDFLIWVGSVGVWMGVVGPVLDGQR
ncbi:MAG: hypothetical protein Q9220_003404 [cf. Caloplaca sp. 1 TL-2023]